MSFFANVHGMHMEVVVDGLQLFHGAQLADATLVCSCLIRFNTTRSRPQMVCPLHWSTTTEGQGSSTAGGTPWPCPSGCSCWRSGRPVGESQVHVGTISLAQEDRAGLEAEMGCDFVVCAFASSVLDRRGGFGSDGAIPIFS